ncbi:MAG: ACP S-malonyltransferase [candidate division NC10 bacterium]|nr:ACP S-malonyltransferase [candidate division NC10 bacterium]MBI4391504.1 ACP S-malonyltransferase [candidate division NC10 bacterium]
MGRAFAEAFPEAAARFAEASEALGFDLAALCFHGPAEALALTANTQPAILTASMAALAGLTRRNIRPDFVAGHSMGEYSALVAAGALDFAHAVRLVRKRGEFMQEAVAVGVGTMAALIGLEVAAVQAVCGEAADAGVVEVANLNAPDQIVIAGERAAVERAVALAKARGAKRAVPLPVSAPFHCRLMQPAAARLREVLATVPLGDLQVPWVTNVDAVPIRKGAEVAEALVRQVAAPIRWVEGVERLRWEGVETFVEVGPGKVLTGLIRRIAPEVRTFPVEDLTGLEAAAAAVGGAR